MNLRRALFVAAFALPIAAGPALAQFQPPPPQAPPQQGGEPPCMKDFSKLRDDAEKHAAAVMAAQKNKVPLPEACKVLSAFAVSQEKFLNYAKKNQVWCGIPPQLIQQITMSYSNVSKARTTVCQRASMPQPAAGPSLSDALSAPVTDSRSIKTGRGTFDTLTGTPLGNTVK